MSTYFRDSPKATLHLDQAKRVRTIVRVDTGGGRGDNINWLLFRSYEVLAKEYSE